MSLSITLKASGIILILNRTHNLKSRLKAIIFTLSIVFFIFTSLLVFFVAFGIEDAVINDQLKQFADSKSYQANLPANVRMLDSLESLGVDAKYLEEAGEVNFGGSTFHYMQQGDGYIVMELLSVSAIQRGVEEIFLFLSVSLIPCFIFTYFVSNWVTNLALEPYARMSKQLALNSDAILQTSFVEQFKQTDIRNICATLQSAIQAKYSLLKKQEEFNKGMSHELRTPLQVMTLATESLSLKVEGLNDNESFKRIERSIDRINRTSSALLWLNSSKIFSTKTNAKYCIEKCHRELRTVLSKNDLRLNVEYLGDFMPIMPAEVLELVIMSLVQNAINHGDYSYSRQINIIISDFSVEISNPASTSHCSEQSNGNFGIGIPMITSLLDKFMLKLIKNSCSTNYKVTIIANSL